jgi:hypothetical protein
MSEQKNIQKNVNGEFPTTKFQVLQIRNISSPNIILDNFKKAVIAILKNKKLPYDDKKWEKILPFAIVNKIKQLNENDFKYDELLDSVSMSVYCFQNIKEWEWYSSKIYETGFDVVFSGYFNAGQFINFIHCQNVPLKNIKVIDGSSEIYLQTIKDYTEVKELI